MTKNLIKVSLLSVLALVCTQGSALAYPPHSNKFEQQDTNKDGKVSQEEATKDAQKRFEETDANHDGSITKEELAAHYDKKRKEHCND